jgi:hypothetical protein
MSFADDWPENCPPTDAEEAAGMVYRLAHGNPMLASDVQTHHETGKLPNAPACPRCGLSVFRTKEDAEHQYRAYPKLGDFVACGELRSEHGVTKLTQGKQPTHTTWWSFEGVARAEVFISVEAII